MQSWLLCQQAWGGGASFPLHWLPVTGSLPDTQEENLAEPRERSIPLGQSCQQGGLPGRRLSPAQEAQAGEGWDLWPPWSPGYSLEDKESESSPSPWVLPLSLG